MGASNTDFDLLAAGVTLYLNNQTTEVGVYTYIWRKPPSQTS